MRLVIVLLAMILAGCQPSEAERRAEVDRIVKQALAQAQASNLEKPPVEVVKPKPVKVNDYPRYAAKIPLSFLGRWDEIQADKCYAREARYELEPSELAEFEVRWEVSGVKLNSPNSIEISTTLLDEEKNQVDQKWQFDLIEGGTALVYPKKRGTLFRKCPKRGSFTPPPMSE